MARSIVYRGRKIQVALDSFSQLDGSLVERDVVLHPGAVAIIPFVDSDHLCLVRNERGIIEETLLEIPAGTLEANEHPDHAAPRELEEETGYRAGTWRKLIEFFPSPGVLSEKTHLYLAQDLIPGLIHLQPDEKLEPVILSLANAYAMLASGEIRDAKTIIALLWWDRFGGEVATAKGQ